MEEEFFSVGDKIRFAMDMNDDAYNLFGKIVEIHIEPDQTRWLKIEGIEDDEYSAADNGWYNSRCIAYAKFIKR